MRRMDEQVISQSTELNLVRDVLCKTTGGLFWSFLVAVLFCFSALVGFVYSKEPIPST